MYVGREYGSIVGYALYTILTGHRSVFLSTELYVV